ncbi:uncharacterized protein FIESC28_08414 [Fusarium coffeatum]|uniref:Protein kinase domain-containing protein n=1 Tax=Fusarium coffeatum TaxID=231269 RepID=A0A366R722_9HYPO|nr:uncharacterized protein FIESC28_08414 [Fusarium coffeatum]RBR12923.1 hypothetical protein FIESC28_08414 [Fusarium coffeatum]
MPLPPPFDTETRAWIDSMTEPFPFQDTKTSESAWKFMPRPPPLDAEIKLLAASAQPCPWPVNFANHLPKPPPSRDVEFRFGSRTIKAAGAPPHYIYGNVLRLKIRHNFYDRLVQSLFSIASRLTGSLLPNKFPEWFLPDEIVLKSEKDDWEEEFDKEIVAYNKLRPIQGDTIPRYYGCTTYNNRRAIVVSDVGGFCLNNAEGAVLSKEDLEPLIYQSLRSLNAYGVEHCDPKLDNYMLVTDNGRDKIVVIDLEKVEFGRTGEELLPATECDTGWLGRQYELFLEGRKLEGIVLPSRPVRL